MDYAVIEQDGYEFLFEGLLRPEYEGIGHYEFWGHREFDNTWVDRLQEANCTEILDSEGNSLELEKFQQKIEEVKHDNWSEIEDQLA